MVRRMFASSLLTMTSTRKPFLPPTPPRRVTAAPATARARDKHISADVRCPSLSQFIFSLFSMNLVLSCLTMNCDDCFGCINYVFVTMFVYAVLCSFSMLHGLHGFGVPDMKGRLRRQQNVGRLVTVRGRAHMHPRTFRWPDLLARLQMLLVFVFGEGGFFCSALYLLFLNS